MNSVALIGTMCNDPEMKKSQGGTSMTGFRVAVRRNYKNAEGKYESDFINCKAFKHNADYVCNYAHKGDKVALTGRIQTGSYEKQDGTKVYTTDIMVDNVEVIRGKAKSEDEGFKEVADEKLPWEV